MPHIIHLQSINKKIIAYKKEQSREQHNIARATEKQRTQRKKKELKIIIIIFENNLSVTNRHFFYVSHGYNVQVGS